MTNSPEVIVLDNDEVDRFERRLENEGLRLENSKFDLAFCHPVLLPEDMAAEMLTASDDLWKAHLELIDRAGGITEWMDQKSPTLTHKDGRAVPLNNPDINDQLQERLSSDNGWNSSFMAYDCMYVKKPDGQLGLSIIEAQSLGCHAGWMESISRARGDDLRVQYSRFIGATPLEALGLLKDSFDGPITVLDMNHGATGAATYTDKLAIAKALDDNEALPITPLQIKKVNKQWFAIDDNGHQVPITSVYSRLMQEDLDEMCNLAESDQLELLKEFFNDPSINWLHHPTWQYIVNKSTLPEVARSDIQGEFRKHLMPTYLENETIAEPGQYVIKPVGGNSGNGQQSIQVKNGDNYPVPPNFIAQQRFIPAPIPLDGPDPRHLGMRSGILEIRAMYPPQPKNEPPNATLMARLAPHFYPSPNGHFKITQTNLGKIIEALEAHNVSGRMAQARVPFGLGPALIKHA